MVFVNIKVCNLAGIVVGASVAEGAAGFLAG